MRPQVIYATIAVLLFGPIITQIVQPVTKSVVTGIIAQARARHAARAASNSFFVARSTA